MDEMKITSIVPWFGSKRSIAPAIVELIGKHKSYWEPFCGSMAVLFAKPVCSMETVNDMHGDLVNLARVIQDPVLGEKLYDKLLRTLCAERFFIESKERAFGEAPVPVDGVLDVDRAYDYFVVSWLGLNGVSGTQRCNYQFALRWKQGGGHTGTRWANTLQSIPAWHRRLRNVLILSRDAFDVIDSVVDEAGKVIYCDPPYVVKSSKYVHDFEGGDHGRLVESLNRFKKTLVIVSYYDHPVLEPLYKGWEKIKIKKGRQSLANARRGGPKKQASERTEILFTNKKIAGQSLF